MSLTPTATGLASREYNEISNLNVECERLEIGLERLELEGLQVYKGLNRVEVDE